MTADNAARLTPVEPPYDEEIETLLSRWMPPGAGVEPLRLFRTLAIHPSLASRMRPLGAGLLGKPTVEAREREIVIHASPRCAGQSTSGACMPWRTARRRG